MDKLRAIQYFVSAVEAGSFAGAARQLEVSVPAVQKLIGALEKSATPKAFARPLQAANTWIAADHCLPSFPRPKKRSS